MYIKMVGGDTCLAVVMQLAPGNSLCGTLQIAVGHYNNRVLPSQFQGHRSEMLGGGPHYYSPHMGTSCEKDLIKFLIKQFRGFLHPSFNHMDKLSGKIGINQRCHGSR